MTEFSLVLRGYDPQQVDELVAQVEGTLGRGPLKGKPITLKQLSWSGFEVVMRGYDRFEVDGAMRRYRRELAELEGVELADDEPDGGLDFVLGSGATPGIPPGLAEQIERAHEFRVRWRGYDRAQVGHFIVRLWAELGTDKLQDYSVEAESLSPAELVDPGFDVVLRGFDMAAVDDAIASYRRQLAES